MKMCLRGSIFCYKIPWLLSFASLYCWNRWPRKLGFEIYMMATQSVMIDKSLIYIVESSTSASGCKSPAAITKFDATQLQIIDVTGNMDYDMPIETVIVGDCCLKFQHTNGSSRNTSATNEQV